MWPGAASRSSAIPAVARRTADLGALAILPDGLLLRVLGALPSGADLDAVGAASRTLHAASRDAGLWRAAVLRRLHPTQGVLGFAGSWRATSVYSDVLFHSRRLAAASVDAAWLAGESVPRVAAADLTAEAFRSRHETANTPVVVTGGMALGVGGVDWADVPALVARWGGTRFHVGGYELRLADYVAYAAAATDDQALVLFDRAFVEKGGPGMGGGYRVPAVFEEDLFERWVLFPPGHPPPGVHTTTTTTTTTDATGATAASPNPTATAGSLAGDPPTPTPLTATSVVSPLTPLEWWSTYHTAAVASPHCVQATCTAGDVMFIPSGWWHAVLNVDPWTVAVTQNYVSTANLPRVRHFLHTRRGDVSGVEGGGGPPVTLMVADVVAGLAASAAAIAVTYPLDTLRTRSQAALLSSTVPTTALGAGWSAAAAGALATSTVKVLVRTATGGAAPAVANLVASAVGVPFDVAKTRAQAGVGALRTAAATPPPGVAARAAAALPGWTATLARDVPFAAVEVVGLLALRMVMLMAAKRPGGTWRSVGKRTVDVARKKAGLRILFKGVGPRTAAAAVAPLVFLGVFGGVRRALAGVAAAGDEGGMVGALPLG
ncbi:hypothetical protein I4F81_005533 [Pyropia yezoensis]|uniref:Uncharacterized protein n=1 Tax=Pyropia yezoensis TaxID=2788 RepID=A0ACC3BYI1_PYRYE|nr:hypothetical protein I4F81_005533 [Neopyropia yezoensis]